MSEMTPEEFLVLWSLHPDMTAQQVEEQREELSQEFDAIANLMFPVAVDQAIVQDTLNVRALPNLDAEILGQRQTGEVVSIWGKVGSWRLCANERGSGWSSDAWLKRI